MRISYNSCRNRHCPKCQGAAARAWLAERQADLLPVPYFHVVFTLPAPIAAVAFQNKAVVYDLLFKAAAETLTTIAADPKHLGARIGLIAVLHTWGSALTHHPHVHCIVPGGGLEEQVVDHGLVLEGDGGDRGRQGEDHVEVGDRQQVRLAIRKPGPGRRALALGAVAVAAGVIAHRQPLAAVTARDVAAELGGAAGLDGRHHLELAQAQVSGVRSAVGLAVGAQDVGHLQGWPHGLTPAAASGV